MDRLDSILGAKDVRVLCIPARQKRLVEARYPPAVWYPERLLELRWQELIEATRESKPLGIVGWFLKEEGTPEVYSAWEYLHEGKLATLGRQFKGPAVKMICVAKCLKNFATRLSKR